MLTVLVIVAVAIVALLAYAATTRPDAKLMGTFFNMERMVGGQFEQGLANLKRISET